MGAEPTSGAAFESLDKVRMTLRAGPQPRTISSSLLPTRTMSPQPSVVREMR